MQLINSKAIAEVAFNSVVDGDTSQGRYRAIPAREEVTIEKVKGDQVYFLWDGVRYRIHINIANCVFPKLRSIWQICAFSIMG